MHRVIIIGLLIIWKNRKKNQGVPIANHYFIKKIKIELNKKDITYKYKIMRASSEFQIAPDIKNFNQDMAYEFRRAS